MTRFKGATGEYLTALANNYGLERRRWWFLREPDCWLRPRVLATIKAHHSPSMTIRTRVVHARWVYGLLGVGIGMAVGLVVHFIIEMVR